MSLVTAPDKYSYLLTLFTIKTLNLVITDNTTDKLTLSKNDSAAVTVPVIERSHESTAGEVSAL